MKKQFERIVKFKPPFDKRNSDPNKNYGIGSLQIWFILKGKKGAVQVLIGTNSYLNSTVREYQRTGKDLFDRDTFACWDVGFHSKKKPSYMEKSNQQKCYLIGKCYYDGSGLKGDNDKVAEMFLEKGEEWIWKYLEKYYQEVFENE